MKIRYQLTILFTTIVASFLFVFCLAVHFFYSQFREKEFFSRLRDKAVYSAEVWNYEENAKQLFTMMYDTHIKYDMHMTSLHGEQIMILEKWGKPEYMSDTNIVITKTQYDQILKGKELKLRKSDREIMGLLYRSPDKTNFVVVI